MATFDQLISRLDPDFRVRGDQFEHICVWYLQNALRFRGAVKNIWFFPEWPGRWDDKDRGVDIIVETVDGEIWAVQAKCYKPQKAVTKRDMDAFLSESSRRGISRRILIMSTDYLAEDSKRTIKDQVVPVEVISLSDLQEERLDWPHDPDDLPRTYPTESEPAVAPDPVASPEPVPGDSIAWNSRGVSYSAKGDYDQAIRAYSEAIRLDPTEVIYWDNRGQVYGRGKKDYDQAIRDFCEVIKLNPRNAKAWYHRGISYSAKGDYDQAIRDINEAVRLEPDDAGFWQRLAYAWHKKGDYDQAIRAFSEAIRLEPAEACYVIERAESYLLNRNFDQAIKDFTEGITRDPTNTVAWVNRGIAYGSKGDQLMAIKDFTEVIRLKPYDRSGWYNRGCAYKLLGNEAKAQADFLKADELEAKAKSKR